MFAPPTAENHGDDGRFASTLVASLGYLGQRRYFWPKFPLRAPRWRQSYSVGPLPCCLDHGKALAMGRHNKCLFPCLVSQDPKVPSRATYLRGESIAMP